MNPIVIGVLIGAATWLARAAFVLWTMSALAKPRPRKADPDKIARLERELGIGPEPHWTEVLSDPNVQSAYLAKMAEWEGRANVVDSEAPTTVQRGPTNPTTFHGAPTFGHTIAPEPDILDDPAVRHGVSTGCTAMLFDEQVRCPRPEGCVAAHPCRACGADKGQPCATTATIWQAPLAPEARKARGIQ